jgi:hypothetical protein
MGVRTSLLVALLAGAARASHAPAKPIPQAVFAMPGEPNHVVIATRFGGMYVTVDGGATFFNACHEALGADDVESYPGAFTASGTLAISTGFRGISTTRGGCDWDQWAPDSFGLIRDVAAFGDRGLVALKGEPELPSRNEVWSSADAGTTWTLAESALPSVAVGDSIRASRDGAKWFVAMHDSVTAKLLRSEDTGRTWASFDFPASSGRIARLVGVSAPPLERLVAILSDLHTEGAEPSRGDVVLLSDDSGERWSPLFESQHLVPGATIDEDGVLFFGGPEDGLYRLALGDVGDVRPVHVSATPTRGLAVSGGRLYTIGDEATDGYTVGVSRDGGATVSPFFALCTNAITGTCGVESSVGESCASFGIETQPWQPLGSACKPAPASPGAPAQGSGGAPSTPANTGGASSVEPIAGSGGDAPADLPEDTSRPSSRAERSSSSCVIGRWPAGPEGRFAAEWVFVLLAAVRRRFKARTFPSP